MNIFKRTLFAIAGVLCFAFAVSAPAANTSSADKIIISGASGKLGELTVKELLARGVKPANLILVSHTPDKLSEYAKMGANVRYGDLTKPESLPAAYAGGTKMLLISVGMMSVPRPELHKAGFDAAVKAGVKHIVYTSFQGADTGASPIAADHNKTEQYLKASGAQWTILRNAFYADMVVQQAAQMVAAGRANVSPNDSKSAPVTREDCAAAAAGALTKPGQEGKIYDITGPELFGTRDIAKAASEITGKPIEIVEGNAAPASAPGAPVGMPGAPGGMPRGPGPGGPGAMPPMAMGTPVVSDAVAKLAGRPGMGVKAILQANKDSLLAAAKK